MPQMPLLFVKRHLKIEMFLYLAVSLPGWLFLTTSSVFKKSQNFILQIIIHKIRKNV